MGLISNGISVTSVTVNSVPMNRVYMNSVLVWENIKWFKDMIITDVQTADVYGFEHVFPHVQFGLVRNAA